MFAKNSNMIMSNIAILKLNISVNAFMYVHVDISLLCIFRFCSRCLAQYTGIAEPQCPMCRVQFDPSKKQRVNALDKRISSTKGICQGCSKKVSYQILIPILCFKLLVD